MYHTLFACFLTRRPSILESKLSIPYSLPGTCLLLYYSKCDTKSSSGGNAESSGPRHGAFSLKPGYPPCVYHTLFACFLTRRPSILESKLSIPYSLPGTCLLLYYSKCDTKSSSGGNAESSAATKSEGTRVSGGEKWVTPVTDGLSRMSPLR